MAPPQYSTSAGSSSRHPRHARHCFCILPGGCRHEPHFQPCHLFFFSINKWLQPGARFLAAWREIQRSAAGGTGPSPGKCAAATKEARELKICAVPGSGCRAGASWQANMALPFGLFRPLHREKKIQFSTNPCVHLKLRVRKCTDFTEICP